jgi:hypothetical protein
MVLILFFIFCFQKYHEQSLNDPAFLTAVWLAKEEVKIGKKTEKLQKV